MFIFLAIFLAGPIGAVLAQSQVALKASPLKRGEQSLKAIYAQEPVSLDPHQKPDEAAWPIVMNAYERLMNFEPGTAHPKINTDLVRTLRMAPNGLHYTFVLVEGRTFSDGMVINSESVLFSFDRLMSSPVGQHYFPHLHRLEIVGPYTFKLSLRRPWPPFLASLALPQASLISPGLRNRPEDYLTRHTLGSGQYTLYDWREGTIGLTTRPDLVARPLIA
ncbi:MAG: ABC transporter substrate-binding protein, partial [Candidatus Adiutrix sp.]